MASETGVAAAGGGLTAGPFAGLGRRLRRLGPLLSASALTAGCVGGPTPEPPTRIRPLPPVEAPPPRTAPVAVAPDARCGLEGSAGEAARVNAASLHTLPWSGFGRSESGWEIYAPAVAAEVGSPCAPASPGFARALRRWQQAQGAALTGAVGPELMDRFKAVWQARRPFVALRARGVCPEPPRDAALETASPAEGLDGKPVQLRRGALDAYRRMVAAARAESAEVRAEPALLTLFSGFRSPAYDAARCARDGNCGGAVRAACSAHRTGLAMDMVMGTAPGYAVDSSADANRLAQVRGPAYRWLIANARRFGFVNYVFEPWHWEWTGETP